MEKAYLKCSKKDGEEFVDEYVVKIDLFDGGFDSGIVRKEHFNKQGDLRVSIVENHGEKALVILPKKLSKKDAIWVNTENLS